MEIYDAFSNGPIQLGDVLRSVERGDLVRVDEMGERWCGAERTIPTLRLEPIDGRVRPFEGTIEKIGGVCRLAMYVES